MTADITLVKDGPIATLLLDRAAKRNALTLGMWQAIPPALDEVEADDDVKVLVVRGAGDKAFSAGADISEFETLRATPEDSRIYNDAGGLAQDRLTGLSKPTIALVRGACVGGGLGVALACDLRFADTSARFAITPAKLGIVYPVRVTKRLVDLVGPAQAKQILFTGAPLDAARAREVGLINDVFAPETVEEDVRSVAQVITERAPYSIRATKSVIEAISAGLDDDDEHTLQLRLGAFETEDYREGVRAFMEKRAPEFTGR